MNDAIRRRQAMVFQRPVMLRRSVAAIIDFALKLGSQSLERRRLALAAVDLADRANQPAKSLSGGEQQRLALARTRDRTGRPWMNRQPTSIASTAAIEDIIQTAEKSGTKIVLVSHDSDKRGASPMRSYSCTAVALSNKLPHTNL